MFGLFIQKGREKKGHSVEQAARLACMEPSAWTACEAGQVPETAAGLRSMARALEFSEVQFDNVIRLCRDAWEG
jgi:transcriptional regulator with XRE-family HTH domain